MRAPVSRAAAPSGCVCASIRLLVGKRARDDRGQVLPLAAIAVLVLALTVMATANLGQTVHAKIKLQNAADSAAYSLAAMEARTFNYIAFLNRAQIAHYNTAMVVQSYITWVGYHVAIFGNAVAWLGSLYGMANVVTAKACAMPNSGVCNSWRQFVGALGVVWKTLVPLSQGATLLYQQASRIGHQIVAAMSLFNRDVIWLAQARRAVLMYVNLLNGMSNYVKKNDDDVEMWTDKHALLTAATAALNTIEYSQAFDPGSGAHPFSLGLGIGLRRLMNGGEYTVEKVLADAKRLGSSALTSDPEVRAYAVMAELCNASRWPSFVYRRGGEEASAGGLFGYVTKLWGKKYGQTRFISDFEPGDLDHDAQIKGLLGDDFPRDVDAGGGPPSHMGYRYSLGTVLASHDYRLGHASTGVPDVFEVRWRNDDGDLGNAVAAYGADGNHFQFMPQEDEKVKEAAATAVEGQAGEKAGKNGEEKAAGLAATIVQGSADLARMVTDVSGSGSTSQSGSSTATSASGATRRAMGKLRFPDEDALWGPEGTRAFMGLPGLLTILLGSQGSRFRTLQPEHVTMAAYADRNRPSDPGHAPWPGFAPYFKFNATSDRTRDFNQPSTWIFVSKDYKAYQGKGERYDTGGMPWRFKFRWHHGTTVAELDTTATSSRNIFFEGVNAVARGMAYYHRPSAESWEEQPNFFNPYWRARLAPVGQKLQAVWQRYVGDRITTDVDNAVLRGMVSALRNSQMELFTAAVSSLATH